MAERSPKTISFTSEHIQQEAEKNGMSVGEVVTLLHQVSSEQEDMFWPQAQAIFSGFWKSQREIRERSYEPTMLAFGLRSEFAQKIAGGADLGSRVLLVDIGAATGHQLVPTVNEIKKGNQKATIGVIAMDIDSEMERVLVERMDEIAGLDLAEVVIGDFSDGLPQTLSEKAEKFSPDTIIYQGFYAPSYIPLRRIEALVNDNFSLAKSIGAETSTHILMLNSNFDARVLGKEWEVNIKPRLASEGRVDIIEAAGKAFPEAIGHGEAVKATMPIWQPGVVEGALEGNGYNVEATSVLFGHSSLLKITK